jgi:DedD protein
VEGPVKERLTGALILVAALVIIVPEMLSGPDPKVVHDGVAPAQPADAGPPLRTYSMVLNDDPDSRESGQAALTPQAPTPPATPAAEPESEPAPAAVVPVPEPAPAAVAADVAPEPESAAPPAGKWWAQLGSFSSQENADRLARQLRAAGYSLNVSKINAGGKELYRVRAGPVQSRMDAQALQARLASAGHKSTLVAP